MTKVGVVSLGCDKNRVDTENMLAYVVDAGFEITNDEDEADVIIINTCAFIESSKKESIDTIFDFVGSGKKVIVTGCLPERYKEEIVSALPEVDAFLGINEYSTIGDVIKRVLNGDRMQCFFPCDGISEKRVLTTPPYTAYLKIADGCDNHCTYCAIPKIRGKFRSRPIESLVDETKMLINDYGVKELNIVAQDTTKYGIDLYNKRELIKLLDELSKLDITWIRLLYCYPEILTDDIIEYISDNEKLCKYVDVPMQHINDRILKLMGRKTNERQIKELVGKLKDRDIAIRSSFIVGFPTETEEEYKELYNFIKEYKLNYAGFFAYSKEEGTPAEKLSGQIPKSVKNLRQKEISRLQSAVINENNKNYVGRTIKVLYEGIDYDKGLFYGRPEFCAPEVDAKVLFKSDSLVDVGNFYNIKITSSDVYDLYGERK